MIFSCHINYSQSLEHETGTTLISSQCMCEFPFPCSGDLISFARKHDFQVGISDSIFYTHALKGKIETRRRLRSFPPLLTLFLKSGWKLWRKNGVEFNSRFHISITTQLQFYHHLPSRGSISEGFNNNNSIHECMQCTRKETLAPYRITYELRYMTCWSGTQYQIETSQHIAVNDCTAVPVSKSGPSSTIFYHKTHDVQLTGLKVHRNSKYSDTYTQHKSPNQSQLPRHLSAAKKDAYKRIKHYIYIQASHISFQEWKPILSISPDKGNWSIWTLTTNDSLNRD